MKNQFHLFLLQVGLVSYSGEFKNEFCGSAVSLSLKCFQSNIRIIRASINYQSITDQLGLNFILVSEFYL